MKGEKGRPKIKPSTLTKDPRDAGGKGGNKKRKRRGKPSRCKTQELEIHEEHIVQPDDIPPRSAFKGDEAYVVQELEFTLKNTKYWRARYQSPDGGSVIGELPVSVVGSHFGPTLRSDILSQHYQQHVPQRLILKQLWGWGVEISVGQLNRLLMEGHERFHEEKAAVLRIGLEVSSPINVDDTGLVIRARMVIARPLVTSGLRGSRAPIAKAGSIFWSCCARVKRTMSSTRSREYMKQQKLPYAQLTLFAQDRFCADKVSWAVYLQTLGITTQRHIKIATEGALVGSLVHHGLSPELVMMSDDAGQFKIAGFLNALCWVPAERTIYQLIPGSNTHRAAQERVRGEIGCFYQALKAYQRAPDKKTQVKLDKQFDKIFIQKMGYYTLDVALKRLHENKPELLLALEWPEIPSQQPQRERHSRLCEKAQD